MKIALGCDHIVTDTKMKISVFSLISFFFFNISSFTFNYFLSVTVPFHLRITAREQQFLSTASNSF